MAKLLNAVNRQKSKLKYSSCFLLVTKRMVSIWKIINGTTQLVELFFDYHLGEIKFFYIAQIEHAEEIKGALTTFAFFVQCGFNSLSKQLIINSLKPHWKLENPFFTKIVSTP